MAAAPAAAPAAPAGQPRPAPTSAGGDDDAYADADDGVQQELPTIADIRAAAQRIAPHAHVTPVFTCGAIDRLVGAALGPGGARVHFKAETLQKGGAFKFRGAANAVAQLTPEQRRRGVVTHSSGNHAAALALAASLLGGVAATIVVPRDAPACKRAAVEEYGGRLLLCEPTMAAREAAAARVVADTGALLVPPYDHAWVIAGQGTIGLEFLQQVPQLDVLVVPVSGGGMLSGIALAARALEPACVVLAAEPRGTNDAADVAACVAHGHLCGDLPRPRTIADGLQARLGRLTWPVVRDNTDGVVVVDEAEIVAAMKLVFERMKLVVEPSGAVGLAAALSPSFAGIVAAAAARRREHVAAAEAAAAAAAVAQQQQPGAKEAATTTANQPQQQQQQQQPPQPLHVGVVLCGGNLDFEAKGFWRKDLWQPAE